MRNKKELTDKRGKQRRRMELNTMRMRYTEERAIRDKLK
jgi:hypothetical protein